MWRAPEDGGAAADDVAAHVVKARTCACGASLRSPIGWCHGLQRCMNLDVLEQRRLAQAAARTVQPLVTHLAPGQQRAGTEQQEECHQHRTIESAGGKIPAQDLRPTRGGGTARGVVARPATIEAEAQVRKQLVERRLGVGLYEGIPFRYRIGCGRGAAIKIERRDDWRQKGQLVVRGPEGPDGPGTAVCRGANERTRVPCRRTPFLL